jgi:hypothetical protein
MMVAGIWTSSKVDQLLRVMIHCDQTKGLFALFFKPRVHFNRLASHENGGDIGHVWRVFSTGECLFANTVWPCKSLNLNFLIM